MSKFVNTINDMTFLPKYVPNHMITLNFADKFELVIKIFELEFSSNIKLQSIHTMSEARIDFVAVPN
jgi:hypothetical protein